MKDKTFAGVIGTIDLLDSVEGKIWENLKNKKSLTQIRHECPNKKEVYYIIKQGRKQYGVALPLSWLKDKKNVDEYIMIAYNELDEQLLKWNSTK